MKAWLVLGGVIITTLGGGLLVKPTVAAPVFDIGFTGELESKTSPHTIGETVRVYGQLQNNSTEDITAMVRCLSEGEKFSAFPFTIAHNATGRVWCDVPMRASTMIVRQELFDITTQKPTDSETIEVPAPFSATLFLHLAFSKNIDTIDPPEEAADSIIFSSSSPAWTTQLTTSGTSPTSSLIIPETGLAEFSPFITWSSSGLALGAKNGAREGVDFSGNYSFTSSSLAQGVFTNHTSSSALSSSADPSPQTPVQTSLLKHLVHLLNGKIIPSIATSHTITQILNTRWLLVILYLLMLQSLWQWRNSLRKPAAVEEDDF